MSSFQHEAKAIVGLREQKKRETKKRITETGVGLFLKQGIDQTTLDEIAVAAGISRRTFFHYFKSKDEILLSLLSGMGEMLTEAVRKAPDHSAPMNAVRDAVLSVCNTIPAHEMIELDGLMHTSPSVLARKQAFYIELESEIFAALRQRCPEPHRSMELHIVAMVSVGTLRLAADIFNQEKGARPMVGILVEIFTRLGRSGFTDIGS